MAHAPSRALRARLLAVVALLALAATYLTPLVNADWNAWRYDHGHASLTGVDAHAHPWQSGEDAPSDPYAADERASLVFTGSDDSAPGITAIWRVAPIEVPVTLVVVEGEVASTPAPVDNLSAPAPPPPRSVLSHV